MVSLTVIVLKALRSSFQKHPGPVPDLSISGSHTAFCPVSVGQCSCHPVDCRRHWLSIPFSPDQLRRILQEHCSATHPSLTSFFHAQHCSPQRDALLFEISLTRPIPARTNYLTWLPFN